MNFRYLLAFNDASGIKGKMSSQSDTPTDSPEQSLAPGPFRAVLIFSLGILTAALVLIWYDLEGPGTARSLERLIMRMAPAGTTYSDVYDRIIRQGGLVTLTTGGDQSLIQVYSRFVPRKPLLLRALNTFGIDAGPLQERYAPHPHLVDIRYQHGRVSSVQRGKFY